MMEYMRSVAAVGRSQIPAGLWANEPYAKSITEHDKGPGVPFEGECTAPAESMATGKRNLLAHPASSLSTKLPNRTPNIHLRTGMSQLTPSLQPPSQVLALLQGRSPPHPAPFPNPVPLPYLQKSGQWPRAAVALAAAARIRALARMRCAAAARLLAAIAAAGAASARPAPMALGRLDRERITAAAAPTVGTGTVKLRRRAAAATVTAEVGLAGPSPRRCHTASFTPWEVAAVRRAAASAIRRRKAADTAAAAAALPATLASEWIWRGASPFAKDSALLTV